MVDKRRELYQEIFKYDAEIYRIKDEQKSLLQKVVDIELKNEGEITEITADVIDVMGLRLGEYGLEPKNMIREEENTKEESVNLDNSKGKKVLLKIPKGTREERREIENALFNAGARYEKKTIPAEKSITGSEYKYKQWYVIKNENTDMTPFLPYVKEEKVSSATEAQQENEEKDSQKSANEEKTYLTIPPVGKKEFEKTIQYFKENGARFDRYTKHWYIVDSIDKTKFEGYLKKESIVEHLKLNKECLENQSENEKLEKKNEIQR